MFFLHNFEQEKEITASVIFWCSFMLLVIAYCSLHYSYVSFAPINLVENTVWVIREWSIWLVISPIIFKTLTRYYLKSILNWKIYVNITLLVLTAITLYLLSYAYFFNSENLSSVAVNRLPKHIVAFTFILLAWHTAFKPNKQNKKPTTLSTHAENIKHESSLVEPTAKKTIYTTLLVHKGADQCIIHIDDIESFSAAGNYVEIHCQGEKYLLRSTLKKVEEKLSNKPFVRTHRSFIINTQAIQRIKIQESGYGLVQLRSGQELSLSKRYRQKLSAFI